MGINIYFTNSLDKVNDGFERNIRLEDDLIDFLWENRELFDNIRYFNILEPYDDIQLSLAQIKGISKFAIEAIQKINEIQLKEIDKEEYLIVLSALNKLCEDALRIKLKLISVGD